MVMKSDEETVRNYLVSVLMESDNYLLRFKTITDVCSQGDVPVVYGAVKKSREGRMQSILQRALAEYSSVHVLYWTL